MRFRNAVSRFLLHLGARDVALFSRWADVRASIGAGEPRTEHGRCNTKHPPAAFSKPRIRTRPRFFRHIAPARSELPNISATNVIPRRPVLLRRLPSTGQHGSTSASRGIPYGALRNQLERRFGVAKLRRQNPGVAQAPPAQYPQRVGRQKTAFESQSVA